MTTRGTTVRKVRMPDTVWDPAMVKAAAEGTTLSHVLRLAVEAFLAAPAQEWEPGAPGKALRPSEAVLVVLEGK
jgi:hypothetical protein